MVVSVMKIIHRASHALHPSITMYPTTPTAMIRKSSAVAYRIGLGSHDSESADRLAGSGRLDWLSTSMPHCIAEVFHVEHLAPGPLQCRDGALCDLPAR